LEWLFLFLFYNLVQNYEKAMTITVIRHPLTDEERSQNRSALIKHLKDRKRLTQEEISADAQNPFFLSKLDELRTKKKLTVLSQ
jgi:hypothetical protein